MDPNQQPVQPNPYEFILNPSQPPKKSFFGRGSFGMKIAVIVGGAVIVMILFGIIISLFSSGSGSTDALKSLVAKQQEIVRIANLGQKNAKSSDTRAYVATVSLSVGTDQNKFIGLLAENGTELSEEELASEQDSKVDSALEAAAGNNRYDEAIKEALDSRLGDYVTSLKSTYDSTSGEKTKAVLSASYSSATAILGLE